MVTFPKLIGLLLLTISFENTIMAMTRPLAPARIPSRGRSKYQIKCDFDYI